MDKGTGIRQAAAHNATALARLRTEVRAELESLLRFWMERCTDNDNGGYYGRVCNDNTVEAEAQKGAVLHARILWAFSAAARSFPQTQAYAGAAARAYSYIKKNFIDTEWGGVYWTVDYKGKPAQTKKQVYAQAFVIYAFSEYYKISGDAGARDAAIALYQVLEERAYDGIHEGYFEAFTRDWQLAEDLRLSAKDANEKKSMNTHLHVLEGYANLYSVWPDAALGNRIGELLRLFKTTIIDPSNGHLRLFFTDSWMVKGDTISYGHDIEAAWLLLEAAEIIGDREWIEAYHHTGPVLTDAAAEGLDSDGGLWYELHEKKLVKEKHWWVQAEALVGFFSGWQITGNSHYLDAAFASWNFIKKHIVDTRNGEWFWGVREDYSIMNEDKAGLWKCPYHNGRACMEIIRRIDSLAI